MAVHLINSDIPLREGVDRIPLCQAKERNPGIVPNAVWAFMWDEDVISATLPDWLSRFRVCAKCVKSAQSMEDRYVYGIVPGQEKITEGDAA